MPDLETYDHNGLTLREGYPGEAKPHRARLRFAPVPRSLFVGGYIGRRVAFGEQTGVVTMAWLDPFKKPTLIVKDDDGDEWVVPARRCVVEVKP